MRTFRFQSQMKNKMLFYPLLSLRCNSVTRFLFNERKKHRDETFKSVFPVRDSLFNVDWGSFKKVFVSYKEQGTNKAQNLVSNAQDDWNHQAVGGKHFCQEQGFKLQSFFVFFLSEDLFLSLSLSWLPPFLFITLSYLISEVQEIGMPECRVQCLCRIRARH